MLKVKGIGPVLVMHGPEVFDSGDAALLAAALRPRQMIVSGIMGRTAAEESGLPVTYDPRPPGRVLSGLRESPVFLVNRGKTPESGRIFGEIVASHIPGRGFYQIECSDRALYCWNGADRALAEAVADRIGFTVRKGDAPATGPAEDPAVRSIRGCIPGEPVFVNGTIIGTATEATVQIALRDGTILPVSGLIPKPHGLEKLNARNLSDLSVAWCKSGSIRKAAPRRKSEARTTGTIAIIDHAGHEIFSRITDRTCGILATGDDTTVVCGHIGLHLGLPVFGVVDGDRDGICREAYAPGSVVVMTRDERDDDVGAELAGRVPAGTVSWSSWTASVLNYLGNRVTVVVPGNGA